MKPRSYLIWVMVLALLPRIAWVLLNWTRGGPAFAYPDEQLHWDLADNLIHQGSLVSADGRYVARMPGYPLYLALFAWLGEGGILLARLGQAILGAGTAALGFVLARDALGPRAGLIAGLLIALDPYGVFFSQLLLTEVLFTFLAVLVTARSWQHLRGHSITTLDLLASGLLLAAALFVRPAGAPWLVLVGLWIAASGNNLSNRVRRVVLLAGPTLLLLLPWGLRNQAVVGSYAWLSGNGGVTLYDAQGPQADGSSDQAFLQDARWQGLGEIERDRQLYAAARAEMARDPARVVRLAWVKTQRTWNPFPNVQEHRQGATAWISATYTLLTLGLAVVGCLRLARTNRRLLIALLLPLVVFTLLHAVFIGSVRYRVPLMPFVVLLGSAVAAQRITTEEAPATA